MKTSRKILLILIFITLVLLLGNGGGVLSEEIGGNETPPASETPPPSSQPTTPEFNPQDYLHGTENLNLPKGEMEPAQLIVVFINYLLTFLGLIGVVIIIIGGIMWATSRGNEDKVNKAKKMIIADVIGLAVVLLSWVIVNFVLKMILRLV